MSIKKLNYYFLKYYMNFASLILDLKLRIIEYLPCEVWVQLAIYDEDIRKHSLLYRRYYIDKYTTYRISSRYKIKNWSIFGRNHRQHDIDGRPQPAVIGNDHIDYYHNGKLHRERYKDEEHWPAAARSGRDEYYYHGKLHREPNELGEYLPAVIVNKGTLVKYYRHGELHRENDSNDVPQPAIIDTYDNEYYRYGNRYRSDGGPVVVRSGIGYWSEVLRVGEKIITIDDERFTNIKNLSRI